MNNEDWKFLKDGEYPEEYRNIWIFYYSNKYNDFYIVLGYMRENNGFDKWMIDLDKSYFHDNDIIIAWQYLYAPERPEFEGIIGGEYITGIKV